VRAALAAALVLATALPGAAAAADAPAFLVEGVPAESGLRALLLEQSRRAHDDARAWFGRGLERPVTVTWIADADALRLHAGRDPAGLAGLAFPARDEIVLYAPALMSRPDRITSVLRHEMWHLLFARATAGAAVEAPRWLDEGLATWRSGEWDLDVELRRDGATWIRDAAAAGHLFAFDDLDARFPEGVLAPLAYAQSASFVQWLARRHGEDRLRAFLAALDRDLDLDPALREAFGEGLAGLEPAWRDDVVPSGPIGRLPGAATLTSAAGFILSVLLIVAWVRKRRRLSRLPDDEPDTPPSG